MIIVYAGILIYGAPILIPILLLYWVSGLFSGVPRLLVALVLPVVIYSGYRMAYPSDGHELAALLSVIVTLGILLFMQQPEWDESEEVDDDAEDPDPNVYRELPNGALELAAVRTPKGYCPVTTVTDARVRAWDKERERRGWIAPTRELETLRL